MKTENYLYIDDAEKLGDIADVVEDLDDIPTLVTINCAGGEVDYCLRIYKKLFRFESLVQVRIAGLASGGASVIAMAGNIIIMDKGAALGVCKCVMSELGDANILQAAADRLRLFDTTIAQIYANRAGGTAEEWAALMDAETWFNAAEAVEAGLADATTSSETKEQTN